jgi:hypothetical protein
MDFVGKEGLIEWCLSNEGNMGPKMEMITGRNCHGIKANVNFKLPSGGRS